MALLLHAMTGWSHTQAATLTLQVTSASGTGIEDAVVYLMPGKPPGRPVQTPTARIDQINKEFVPLVSVVQTGTRISFPNKDNIRHHVYSFSAAKKFEIKLYADTPSKPILFDTAGYVVMGCNIHDHMIAHLLVVDTPYFAKTDANGMLRIADVPPGDYSLIAWYYMRPDRNALVMPLSLKADMTQAISIRTRSSD
ncbi:MAG: methylamine utilization protein [Thiobacillus sp.]|nr:methylamine utilization protein [Thiobacillus sp.]